MSAYISNGVAEGVKSSAGDKLGGPLGDELLAGTGITLTEVDVGGGNIKVQVASSGTGAAANVNSASAIATYADLTKSVKTGVDARILRILISVDTAWDGTVGDAVMTIGDAADNDRLSVAADVDLYTVGHYIVEAYHNYSSATDVVAYLTADSGSISAGSATIELIYSNN